MSIETVAFPSPFCLHSERHGSGSCVCDNCMSLVHRIDVCIKTILISEVGKHDVICRTLLPLAISLLIISDQSRIQTISLDYMRSLRKNRFKINKRDTRSEIFEVKRGIWKSTGI